MAKQYAFIRVYKETKDAWKNRLKNINERDLPNIGVKKGTIPMTAFMDFQAKTKFFISDQELKQMAKKRFKGKIC